MIRTVLYRPDQGIIERGSAELVDAWEQDKDCVIWVNLNDNNVEDETRLLTDRFGLNPLAIQDAQRIRHPPKVEDFGNFSFLLFKGLHGDATGLQFQTIQLALFVGERFLITRHSGSSQSINMLNDEVNKPDSPITKGADVLALRLLRIMVDRYLKMILALEPRLEEIEDEMISRPRDELLAELINYKTNLKKYMRVLAYHVQLLSVLRRHRLPHFGKNREHLINDVYEQEERVSSLASLYYDTASDLIDGYISVASHRLNNIMKILTIITAIFVPLSFLAGIYGMNFQNMPELQSRSGYFILLGFMASIVLILLYVFRKKKWL